MLKTSRTVPGRDRKDSTRSRTITARSASPRGATATVRSIERCLDILDIAGGSATPLSLSQISRSIGAPKSTVLTIVRTLVRRGLLAVDSTKRYRLGLGFARYQARHSKGVDIVEVARPELAALVARTTETASLTVREGHAVFHVSRIVGPHQLQYLAPVGIPRSLHASACGKVLLAFMDEEGRRAFYAAGPLPRHTTRTVVEPRSLERQLKICRTAGYIVTRGETVDGLFGIAAPIRDRSGAVIAAVNLGGPLIRLAHNQAAYVEAVREAAAAISRSLESLGGEVLMPDPRQAMSEPVNG